MRLIATASAQDGSELGRDVLIGRPDGVPMLRAGVRITPWYRQMLTKAGISAIFVEDDESSGIVVEPAVDDATRAIATRAVSTAHRSAKDAIGSGKPLAEHVVASLEDVVARIMRQLDSPGRGALALADLASADAYTFQHSIDVTAVGILVGRRYYRNHGSTDPLGERHFTGHDERLSALGLGLLLHDIGKHAVPLGILNKPDRLTPEEWTIIKSHPLAGIDLLEGNHWDPLVKAVVLRHHERWNGSGYPDGKAGEDIHQMARIAAVADVYDAITSDRLHAPARPACDGVRAIMDGSGTLFDPDVAEAFCSVVAPYPPGTAVELTDGRSGIVVSVPDNAFDRPVVRVLDDGGEASDVALLLEPGITIRGWNGVPGAVAA